MSKNIMTVDCGVNKYRILPVENSDEYIVIKNGKQQKRIKHDELFLDGELIDIDEWFKIA